MHFPSFHEACAAISSGEDDPKAPAKADFAWDGTYQKNVQKPLLVPQTLAKAFSIHCQVVQKATEKSLYKISEYPPTKPSKPLTQTASNFNSEAPPSTNAPRFARCVPFSCASSAPRTNACWRASWRPSKRRARLGLLGVGRGLVFWWWVGVKTLWSFWGGAKKKPANHL